MKYMGSKSRITQHIVPIIQAYIDENQLHRYYEPFCGGCNVIDKINCSQKFANDYNKYLIALFKHLQQGGALYKECSRDFYNKVRNSYNAQDGEFEDWVYGNIGFLASYNGRFFDGGFAQTGYEKTKNGTRLRNYYTESLNNLLEQFPKLKDIRFNYGSYIDTHPHNMLVYADPPYQGTKQYNVSKDFDYDLFWETMRDWSKYNIVLISEENAPKDFQCIWEQSVSRSIKSTDKSRSLEKLFVYKGE